MYKKYLPFVFLLLTFVFLSCDKNKKTVFQKKIGTVFGTRFQIKYQDSLQRDFSKNFTAIFDAVNASVSTYHPQSILSKINRDEKSLIDSIFRAVFEKSKRYHLLTDGFFDPSIGLLVNFWGFGAQKKDAFTPDSLQIDILMKSVGMDKIKINGTFLEKPKGAFLDFNAIAKGYGVDLIGEFLEVKGIENYLVEIGGEVRVRGKNPNKTDWKIGIEKPHFDGKRSLQKIIRLQNEAVATSGNYRKYKIDDAGNRYVHTINPKTGWTAKNNMISASVVGALDCADLDALATAFMAMGFEKSKNFAVKHPELKYYFIYFDKENKIQMYENF